MCCLFPWRYKVKYPEFGDDWYGAGILFTDLKHILSGYTRKYGGISLTGIGGKREGDELYYQTAIRETFEELFGFSPSSALIEHVVDIIKPVHILNNNNYICIVCNITDLHKILKQLNDLQITSPWYTQLPVCVMGLITKRDNIDAEIHALALFPIKSIINSTEEYAIDTNLIKDVKMLIECNIFTPL